MNDALLKAALRLLDAAKGDHTEMTQTTAGHYEFELDLAISGFEKTLDQHANPRAALQYYNETIAETGDSDMGGPLERLRFFCSLSMPGQDWLDVEPFFDALEQEQAEPVQAEPVVCPIGIDLTETKWCSAQICDACKAQQAEPVDELGELRDVMKQAIVVINEAAGATEYYSEHPSMKRWMVVIDTLQAAIDRS
jgi:hypothetical protein